MAIVWLQYGCLVSTVSALDPSNSVIERVWYNTCSVIERVWGIILVSDIQVSFLLLSYFFMLKYVNPCPAEPGYTLPL